MTKIDFYQGKSVAETEWWVSHRSLPDLVWARLRVFDDGTADACWSEGTRLYGFDNRDYAGYLFSEDEYISSEGWDEEDEADYGVQIAAVSRPVWEDHPDQEFAYLGTY